MRVPRARAIIPARRCGEQAAGGFKATPSRALRRELFRNFIGGDRVCVSAF
jgi:hypothetical protein